MKLFVNAKPGARTENVEQLDETHFAVAVKERPRQGEANRAIIKALAKYMDVAPSRLRVRSGKKGREKVIEIL